MCDAFNFIVFTWDPHSDHNLDSTSDSSLLIVVGDLSVATWRVNICESMKWTAGTWLVMCSTEPFDRDVVHVY